MTIAADAPGIPPPHASLLRTALAQLGADARVVGVAAAGSYVTRTMDEFSDLDLVIAVEPAAYDAVMPERRAIAERLGPLLAAFTGEHVGEPRVLICLYGPPLVHVDLKFVRLADAAARVEEPVVLWERDGRLSAVLAADVARFPAPDPQWIEDRFWVWVHYAATKIGRGELFEALDVLAFLRGRVLGPLALAARGARPVGVRRIESSAPDFARELERTVTTYDARACAGALRAAADLYRTLRRGLGSAGLRANPRAEDAAMEYLGQVEAAYARSSRT